MTLTLESARAELRAARAVRRGYRRVAAPMAHAWFWETLRRYRYARCIDLDYAIRLKKHGVNPAGLASTGEVL